MPPVFLSMPAALKTSRISEPTNVFKNGGHKFFSYTEYLLVIYNSSEIFGYV